MAVKVLLNENQYRLLFESDDFSKELGNIKRLIETTEEENIELAFRLGEGMESYIPNFNFKNFIMQEYGSLLNLIPESKFEPTAYDLEDFLGMEHLDLNHKKLGKIPENIGIMKHLTILKLGDNNLTKVPESISKLTNLESLVLSSNKIQSLPDSFANLENLEELKLAFNPISFAEKDKIKKMLPYAKITFT
jgi:hypothetical protein